MKVGFVQMTPEFGEKAKNIETACRAIEKADSDLLVLPEFFNSGYLFTSKNEVAELAEEVESGQTINCLKQIASDTRTIIVAGFPERDGDLFYNSAVTILPFGELFLYRKTHLFDREKLYFQPGNTGFSVVDTGEIRLGMMICFDWFFPESARSLALRGAQIIVHPSNLVLPHCPAAMITRALENKVFTITANRCGSEKRDGMELSYIGMSRIVSPKGEVLASCGKESLAVKIVEIQPELAMRKQINTRNNLFSDRRKEFYHDDVH